MKNLQKRINIRLVYKEKDFLEYSSRSTYNTHKIFYPNYAAIYEVNSFNQFKLRVLTIKPIFVGFLVLALSKWLWMTSITTLLKEKINAELLFTDIESLTYQIKSEDVYEESFKQKYLFHFSNYSKASKFFDPSNKMFIGKIKDVSKGKIIGEFVGLKSKMYSMKNIWL